MRDRTGIDVDLRLENEAPLPEEVEICIYRIVQEALANVEKHAAATAVRAEIRQASGELRVAVHDNGRGVDLPTTANDLARQGRFGVLGMRERAALVGGTLRVTSPAEGATESTTRGTSVLLSIPLP